MERVLFFICIFFHCFFFGQMDSIQKIRFAEAQERYAEKCYRDEIRAIEDSKTQIIYYINLPTPTGEEFLPEKELRKLLKTYGITFGGTWMGSDIMGYYSSNQCYKSYMTKFAEQKFGEKFFEDKIDEALRIYLKNNTERVFDYRRDDIDAGPNLYGAKSRDEENLLISNGFWKRFRIPTRYINRRKDETYSHLSADFVVDQKGRISELTIHATIQNSSNIKYKNILESNFKKFIKTLKWRSSTYKGYKVKNLLSITVYLP